MGTIDEVQRMQREGKGEEVIRNTLRQRGLLSGEVENVLNQAKIKDAVSEQSPEIYSQEAPIPEAQSPQEYESAPQQFDAYGASTSYEGMEPSMMDQQTSPSPYYQQTQAQEPASSQYQDASYPSYQPYQEAFSSDVITEISEQVVSERLASLRDKLEQSISFKNIAETKLSTLSERLERIEQILDRLQLSILQKVGDYVNDVHDMKNELQETHKSFKKLSHPARHHGHGKKHLP